MRDFGWCTLLLLLATFCLGQDKNESDEILDILENTFDANEELSNNLDFNTLEEDLQLLLDNKININSANEEELAQLPFLNHQQVAAIVGHIAEFGDLVSIYELQSIPSLDIATIKRLVPFVSLQKFSTKRQISPWEQLKNGDNRLYLRWTLKTPISRGFTDYKDKPPVFEGNPSQYYIRYRRTYENFNSIGFTAEKDPGEAFFAKSNKNSGFDYYSFHYYQKDISNRIRRLAIGDYTVSMGQGLLMHSGFGYGKTSYVINIKKSAESIRPYASLGENQFLRGIASEYRLSKSITATSFVSYNKYDGNAFRDTTSTEEEYFSSLQTSGLHRTASEIEDKNAVGIFIAGQTLKYERKGKSIALNGLYTRFNQPFRVDRNVPYRKFQFTGQDVFNLSTDYSFGYRGLTFFGELATSDFTGFASLNGVMTALSRQLDVALLHRYYSKDHFALFSGKAFGEANGSTNEHGMYLAAMLRFNKTWSIRAYADFWQYPWLRSRIDGLGGGEEYLVQLNFYKKRKVDAYLRYTQENKLENFRGSEDKLNGLGYQLRQKARFHVSYKINPRLEHRTRGELVRFQFMKKDKNSLGWMFYQDLIYRPIDFPLSFSLRLAIFDTDDYDSRIYAYENDILASYSVPALYGEGIRSYINLRYRPIRDLTIEGRYSITKYADRDFISSGANLREGAVHHHFKAQMLLRF